MLERGIKFAAFLYDEWGVFYKGILALPSP
jgi:hypothetical protein